MQKRAYTYKPLTAKITDGSFNKKKRHCQFILKLKILQHKVLGNLTHCVVTHPSCLRRVITSKPI